VCICVTALKLVGVGLDQRLEVGDSAPDVDAEHSARIAKVGPEKATATGLLG